jgi:GNAT superfamily N-acetyltransferase
VIRPATPADAAALGAMHAQAWKETYPGLVPDEFLALMTDPARRGASWAAIIAAPLLPDGVLIAEDGDGIAGFVSVCPARDAALTTAGEVSGIYLLRRAQGRGIATALLHAGFSVLRGAGLGDAAAWCLLGNKAAERFYAARGAVPGPRRTDRRGEFAFEEIGWVWADIRADATARILAAQPSPAGGGGSKSGGARG